jgi:hypothetical protein
MDINGYKWISICSLFWIAEKFDPLQTSLEALKRDNFLIEELSSLQRAGQ